MKKEKVITINEDVLFPRNLYKSPGSIPWGSKKQDKSYDTVLVENEEGYKEAIREGYIDNFHEALFEKGEKNASKKGKVEEDDF